MKYLITEKPDSMIVFIDLNNLRKISEVADFIDERFPGVVLEVIHNRMAKQGSIILKKENHEFMDKINQLLT